MKVKPKIDQGHEVTDNIINPFSAKEIPTIAL